MKTKKLFLLTLLLNVLVANDKFESAYTSIENCKLIETYEMNMGVALSCESYGNMEVEVSEYDIRTNMILHRDNKEYSLKFSSTVSASFSSLGKKIEWRYLKGKAKNPIAMITRLDVSEYNQKTEMNDKDVSYLVISKITKDDICVVGKILPQKSQNILARKMADKARSMPCLLKSVSNNTHKSSLVLAYSKLEEKASKNQKTFSYLQNMGPIEQSLRILKKSKFPIWRMHLKLYPMFEGKSSQLIGYRVEVERKNLSTLLYKELVASHGKENVDESLDNYASSERYVLFYDRLRSPAIFNEEGTKFEKIKTSNLKLWDASKGDWGKPKNVKLSKAPWETKLNAFPAMVRALAKETGWLKKNGLVEEWSPMEIPEGMNEKTPWVEIVIDNQVGNGGGYVVEWHDLVSDDSISQTLYSLYSDNDNSDTASFQSAVLCARGDNTTLPTQRCK